MSDFDKTRTTLCQCDRHDPPLFAQCGAKIATGEMFCEWCKNGHVGKLGVLKAVGRTVGHAMRLWARDKFGGGQ